MTYIHFKMNEYIQIAVNGIFVGLGASIGTYIGNKHINKKLENLHKKAKGGIQIETDEF